MFIRYNIFGIGEVVAQYSMVNLSMIGFVLSHHYN